MGTKKIEAKKEVRKNGFTLIEILVVIGLIVLLAAIVIVAINPARQFAQGRNTQRISNVSTILNAIGQNIADNKGIFTCTGVSVPSSLAAVPTSFVTADIPTAAKEIGSDTGLVDLESCLVPNYISIMPVDPTDGDLGATRYFVVQDNSTNGAGRITVYALNVESALGEVATQKLISVTR